MTEKDLIEFWLETAENDYTSAVDSFIKKHYDWAFFQYNLAIEKLLKGLVYKQNLTPKFTHDLLELAKTAKISLPKDTLECLAEINTYNISARYDDFKRTFYLKVTKSIYYTLWQKNCRTTYLWLKKQY